MFVGSDAVRLLAAQTVSDVETTLVPSVATNLCNNTSARYFCVPDFLAVLELCNDRTTSRVFYLQTFLRVPRAPADRLTGTWGLSAY